MKDNKVSQLESQLHVIQARIAGARDGQDWHTIYEMMKASTKLAQSIHTDYVEKEN